MKSLIIFAGIFILTSAILGGCGGGRDSQLIDIDGSSTVYPITEAVAEEYYGIEPEARIIIGISGTGGGFKRFQDGETAISNASRPIKSSEAEACEANGVEYIELPIAYDGIAVVVNPENDWVDHMTTAELKITWEAEAEDRVMLWSQIREGWPEREIHLYGPGIDSGTYDYFTEVICGVEGTSRGDFTPNEDDNVLVHGIASDEESLGFFGLAYYIQNTDILKIVPVDDGDDTNGLGPIIPDVGTVADGTYQPLSRPIFIYVNLEDADTRPEVAAFVEFYLENAGRFALEVGYVAMPSEAYDLVKERFAGRITGSG